VIHVRPEIRRRVHRRRFFRKVALVLIGSAIIAGTMWQHDAALRAPPAPKLPPPLPKPTVFSWPPPAPLAIRSAHRPDPSLTARPISTTPIPVASMTAALKSVSALPLAPSATFPAPPPPVAAPMLKTPAPAAPPPAPETPESSAGRTSIVAWLESTFPLMVRTLEERVAASLVAAKNRDTTIKFSEREFQQLVVRQIQARSLHQLQDLAVTFHPEGIQGSGVFMLGPLPVPFSFQATIEVVNGRPHAVLQALNAGGIAIPDLLLKALEGRVNEAIDRDRLPLELKWFRMEERQVLISAELAV